MNLAGIIKRIEELRQSVQFYEGLSEAMLAIATGVQRLEHKLTEHFTAAAKLEEVKQVYERMKNDPRYGYGDAQADLQQILEDEG